ncbi:MAG: response regulator [Roseimicrobium sp.]
MKRILIVEDQPQMRQNLSLMLELNGFSVLAASNGKEGVAIAKQEHPNLILCDVMMPELDGYGVLHALRMDDSTKLIPFIFLTAKGEKHELRTGMNLGADDYLTKPVTEAELLASVNARMRRMGDLASVGGPDYSSHEPLLQLGLSEREAEVLLWVAQGKSNGDIAIIPGMSEATAKKHMTSIFQKISVESRSAAAVRAVEVLSGRL